MTEEVTNEEFEEESLLILVDEEGQEHAFIEVADLDIEENKYKILLPAEEDSEEAIIFKCGTDDEGNDILMDIEDDEEWDKVADAWSEMVEQAENE